MYNSDVLITKALFYVASIVLLLVIRYVVIIYISYHRLKKGLEKGDPVWYYHNGEMVKASVKHIYYDKTTVLIVFSHDKEVYSLRVKISDLHPIKGYKY